MKNGIKTTESQKFYSDIAGLINNCKHVVQYSVNSAMVMLYWNIGKYLVCKVLEGNKAEYGQKVVEELSEELSLNYGKNFGRASLFRMIQFYREFSEEQIVVTLSRQLTWSHFVALLPIEDATKREFYAVMCSNENWSVRTLRERRKSMLFERTAISKKPEETIKNDLDALQSESKMSPDLFYRDPYVLDFLGLKDAYSEKEPKNTLIQTIWQSNILFKDLRLKGSNSRGLK